MNIAEIGYQIRKSRIERGMTLVELAERARVSRATLDALENERKSDIGVKTLGRLLSCLGLEITIAPAKHRRPTLYDLIDEAENETDGTH